MKGKEGKS